MGARCGRRRAHLGSPACSCSAGLCSWWPAAGDVRARGRGAARRAAIGEPSRAEPGPGCGVTGPSAPPAPRPARARPSQSAPAAPTRDPAGAGIWRAPHNAHGLREGVGVGVGVGDAPAGQARPTLTPDAQARPPSPGVLGKAMMLQPPGLFPDWRLSLGVLLWGSRCCLPHAPL